MKDVLLSLGSLSFSLVSLVVNPLSLSNALAHNKKNDTERLQALKLLRRSMELAPEVLPRAPILELIAIVDQPQDDLSVVCVETLIELAALVPQSVSSVGGIRALIRASLVPEYAGIQESIVVIYSYLVGDAATRRFLRLEQDIGYALAPLNSDFHQQSRHSELSASTSAAPSALDADHVRSVEVGWKASLNFFRLMVRSWPGLLALTSPRMGLRAVVSALKVCLCVLSRVILF
jgi:Rapamycin-insensitive companion of mTOR, N-term